MLVCRWQAALRPGAISVRTGRTSRQTGIACSQRGWNGQPGGGANGEGNSPLSGWKARLRRAAEGIAAIDAVHVDIGDERGLRREAHDAAASGFQASACIHPGQVETIRAAYRPDAETLAWAHGVLAAAEGERGVFRYEGRMVDEPVLRHARSVLARA